MKNILSNITINQYVDFYFSDKKPNNWEEINNELNKVLNVDKSDFFLELNKSYLSLLITKMIDFITKGKIDPRLDIKLEAIRKKIDDLIKATGENSITEDAFVNWIVNISKWMGYRIDRDKVTMYEFAIMSNKMLKEEQIIKEQHKKIMSNGRKY
jgi:hypothetical protein